MRARLLRRARIAHRTAVLDLGAGHGIVTRELARRCQGTVVAVDRRAAGLASLRGVELVVAEADALPLEADRFDLVFAQCFFMWNPHPGPIVREAVRVLQPGGALVAIEPDYGGLIEHPDELALAPIWRAALSRAGADPLMGRRLPAELARAGLDVRIDLLPAPSRPDRDRFELIGGLPLTDDERSVVERAAEVDAATPDEDKLLHLPFVCASATKPR